MPQLANVTVKKNDGVTDIVYTGIQPQGGVDIPAKFRSQTVGSAISHNPELRVTVRDKGKMDECRASYKYPDIATNSTTGITASFNEGFTASLSITVDKNMTTVAAAEAASQFVNLMGSTLIKQLIKERTAIV